MNNLYYTRGRNTSTAYYEEVRKTADNIWLQPLQWAGLEEMGTMIRVGKPLRKQWMGTYVRSQINGMSVDLVESHPHIRAIRDATPAENYLASLPEGGPTDEEIEDVFLSHGPGINQGLIHPLRALFAADKARAVAEKELEIQVLELWKQACLVDVSKMLQDLAAKDVEIERLSHPKGTWPEPIEIMDVMKIRDEEDACNISRLFAGFIGDYETLKDSLAMAEKNLDLSRENNRELTRDYNASCRQRDVAIREHDTLRQCVAELEGYLSGLSDPATVLVNILRGTIVLPAHYQEKGVDDVRAEERIQSLEKENRAAKATLIDACICTNHNPGFSRKGWAYFSDCERAYLEIEYRDWPLFPTAEEAVNDALAKRIAEEERP